MSNDGSRRQSSISTAPAASIPNPPPLPAPRPLQRARDAAYKFIGYPSRPSSPQVGANGGRISQGLGSITARYASLSATQNATAIHKTGLEINTIAINERGTHALLGGKEIFKTIKIEGSTCVEEVNLRTAIRSTPTAASGKPRQTYSIDIADVAWAKGDCGDYVAAATSSGKIILYDLGHAGFPAAQLHEHLRQVHKVTFNPHRGNYLLSGSQDGTVRLWDLRDVRQQASALQSKRKYSGQNDGVRDVKWSPTDGVDFAIGTDSGWIQRWDIRNMKGPKVRVPAHSLSCNIIDWHPDGKHIASASSDKFVRIWDFSHSDKQTSLWEIKTPYPVMNARWRPPCEASMPQENGARQCTQLVTAYDREHPVIHIWDLRRPSLPFREMVPYQSAPTDLLWHSQDLLWTVGREGTFLQSDIQHAPKVIDKRNLSSFAISPEGDVTFVAQKRRQRRSLKLHHASAQTSQNNNNKLSVSPDATFLSRSWVDDSLDHSFLRVNSSKRHEMSKNPSSTAINNEGLLCAVVPLNKTLDNGQSFAPQQVSVEGKLPYFMNTETFRYLAAKYIKTVKLTATIDDSLIRAVEDAFHKNSRRANYAGLLLLSGTWDITQFVTINHLKARAEAQRKKEKDSHKQIVKRAAKPSLAELALKLLAEHDQSSRLSPASLRPISALTHHLAVPESTSNVPTPLARPVNVAKPSASHDFAQLPDIENSEDLTLPPSLSPVMHHRLPDRSFFDSQLTADNLNSLQDTDRTDMVRRWSTQPKTLLSLDPVDTEGIRVPPKLQKHDSDESFAFLVGSTGSSVPASYASAGPMVSERPSRRHPGIQGPSEEAAAEYGGITAARSDGDDVRSPLLVDEPVPIDQSEALPANSASPPNKASDEPLYSLLDDSEEDLEERKPIVLVELLAELMKHHLLTGDAQTATHLITLIEPLLPRTHPLPDDEIEATVLTYTDTYAAMGLMPDEIASIFDKHLQHTIMAGLQPLQIESILSFYHDQLMSFRMFSEAAYLRKLAYPAYPAVYEDFMQDNNTHIRCGGCGKPIQSGRAQLKCESCKEKQAACPICWLNESPYGGGTLMSACMLCGHAGHAECLRQWFEDAGGEECPTGCGCVCKS
ncbi:hypothetical protein LTR36_005702 [Oleoguttula mirabilis]|uniref:Restriction of telomere capping protein 1 n=1 Tax=Oleoguttula mirabilis TaxID=1507867 RepID=A0AAV9JDH9_9PEZI|nr:hypothetical protein LTR36_005702 [Oleoguttula mirabilis]